VVSAPINRERLHTPKAALVARLQTGTWPAEVALDIERAERRDQADLSRTQRSRWSSALHSAWLDQRRQTPRGELVDDAAVVDIAVTRYGVPREFAEKERGLA
jgi:hypothetical protein